MTEKSIDNLAVRVSSDPILMKNIFSRLKDPQYAIPNEYEEQIKKLRGLKSTEKGVLVSRITSPDDYQTQLKLLSHVQNMLDHMHEIHTNLLIILARWKELHNAATRVIMLNYFNEINELKEGVRKVIMNVALAPIQDGIDRLGNLILLSEITQKHLVTTNWNIKESSTIIKDYLSLYKFGSSVRVPSDAEV